MKLARITLATLLGTTSAMAMADADLDSLRAELNRQRVLIDAQQQQIEALAIAQENRPSARSDTTVGMYGEVHFNSLREEDPLTGKRNIHAHRVVLLLNHRFRDDLSFFSELEFEGAPDSTDIETEVEQFGINWQIRENLRLTLGQFLVPVGLLNETHEPDAIYGVERNPIEEFIIPATWWEKGVMAGFEPGPGIHLDIALHNGLRGDLNTLGTSDGLREFRQEFGGARADDPAITIRAKYTGIAGLELGAALQQQNNITQSNDLLTGGEAPAQLWELHGAWNHGRFGLRVLAAGWTIDSALAKTNGTDQLQGWYAEPVWKAAPTVGLFARYNQWNTAVGTNADSKQTNAGINWWIDPRVVLKADLQDTNQPDHAGDGFNLGMGLSF